MRAEESRSEEHLSCRKFGFCQRSLPPSCCCPPLAGPSTVETGLEGQRLKVVEGAGGPPRDPEEFPSSPLAPSLAMCLLKAWCSCPSRSQRSAHPRRCWAQWPTCCMDSEGLTLPRSRRQS